MAVQFILGSSISLKSEIEYARLLTEAGEKPDCLWQVVVPEQSTLVAQKKVLEQTENLGLMQVDILSFNRLAYRIMEDVHQQVDGILDDTGKSMLLRKIAAEVADGLELYHGNLSRKGFIEQLKSMLSEFLQYRVMPEQLRQIADSLEEQPLLQHKIRDLEKIYRRFQERKKGGVITLEELLPKLCEHVADSAYVQRSVFIFDGFTGFTPVQYRLIELLMQKAQDVRIILTMDPEENPYRISGEQELFYMSKQVISRVTALADECAKAGHPVRILPVKVIRETKEVAEPIRALEAGVFRYPLKVYSQKTDAISLHRAGNPEEEVQYVLTQVLSCIREGRRYREIAVICSDLTTYAPVIEKWFGRSGLPIFIDRKKNLLGNPLIELIAGALELLRKQYSYESMFHFLRNRLVPLERMEVDYLENYVKALGIQGRRWKQEWDRSYYKMPTGEEHLAMLNRLREQITVWFAPLEQLFGKKADVREITRALYLFLQELSVEETLLRQADAFEQAGELLLAKEYRQCFGKVMGLLDELVDLMGGDVLDTEMYLDVLNAGFENLQVGLIPPAIDRLVIGDLQRTRLNGIKVLFLLGCNDAFIPAAGDRQGLLSDLERELLKKVDVELAPTGREEGFNERFYLYLMLTKPSDALHLVWSGVSSEGKTLRPCYLISQTQKMFPGAVYTSSDTLSAQERIWQPQESLGLLMEGLRGYRKGSTEDWWRDLYGWYHRQEDYRERLEHALGGLFAAYRQEHLPKHLSSRIFGRRPLNSVTRLEAFSACAYAHFLTYGLGLAEREEYQIDAADYGNIFHESIEKFFHLLQKRGIRWQELSEEERLQYVQESVQEVTQDYGNTILKSSARYRYLVGRLEKMTDKTIWALEKQLQAGEFTASGSEVLFSAENNTPDMALQAGPGVTVKLHGRIDRVDLVETDSDVYVKIVDYKSGSTVLDLTKLYYGLQLQLILYLSAAMELTASDHPQKNIIPAGVYYYNIRNPIVEHPELSEEEEGFAEALEEAVLDELRMNGLTNRSSEIAHLIDHTDGKRSAVVKNLSRDSAGEVAKSSLSASSDEMRQLCRYSKKKAASLCREMLDGEISVNPYEYKNVDSCQYCAYKGICGFDTGIPGYRYRRLQPMTTEEVLAMISEEE